MKKRLDRSQSGNAGANNPFTELAALKGQLESTQDHDVGSGDTPASSAAPSFGPKLVVRRERAGRGGKTVTVVTGFSADTDLDTLCASLRKALGTGGQVEGETVVLHGDIGQRAADWLSRNGARKVVLGN